ncbi:uncharacterized protein LOC133179746 [Saccostrea echinata]|uniref:uncharacterized protein LOC133179746 n=1 Tax=Saccostrea echinata TaxID=191078 RepID=UPI002A81734E|nr:uncharacterized protein LOC133179746 [Saccostrea echinata]
MTPNVTGREGECSGPDRDSNPGPLNLQSDNLAQKSAFKGKASESDSAFKNNWGSADRAVDGYLQDERGEATCSFTTALYYKTAWWKFTLSQLSNVAYLEIFFRKSTVNRHVGFSVYVFNESWYIPPSTGGYNVFSHNKSSCPNQVMNVTINKLTRGIALFNSKNPPLQTSCTGYEPSYATIEVCEVMVMGCKFQHYGDPCKLCSANCLNRQCDAFDGSCIYGCSDHFVYPPDCSSEEIPFI